MIERTPPRPAAVARTVRVVTFTELARAFGVPKDTPLVAVRVDGPNVVLEYEAAPRTADFYLSRRPA